MKIKQIIYGTFPDLPGSQQVVYRSEGISAELESRILSFYRDFGDCKNPEFKQSLTVLWLDEDDERIAAITKVSHQEKDFSGRWGALLRHTAILGESDFAVYYYDPVQIAKLLVTGGSSEKLAASVELDPPESIALVDVPSDAPTVVGGDHPRLPHEDYFSQLLQADFAIYKDNLRKLLSGEKLVFYAENNTDYTDSYCLNLIRLLPLRLRTYINYSQFSNRLLGSYDLALVYGARRIAPEAGTLTFNSSPENSLSAIALPAGFVENYLAQLENALSREDTKAVTKTIMEIESGNEEDS